ncbi:glycerol kinase [Candidatus Marinamargulisbacteria bacterium SCGC AG-439-L15]|nr:glycerol kinase [Candidatus Marinamargulisbacteria bacterium SCGC AG-439-L15]
MGKDYIIALDLGTTGNRALLFNTDLELQNSAYLEFKNEYPKPGWVEQDPLEIWSTTEQVLQTILKDIDPNRISGIGITNQRETTLLWDSETGSPFYKAIVWQCRRTQDLCESLAPHHNSIKEKTGLPCDPYFSATKIQWILNHVPEAKTAAQNGRLRFGTVDTWILWQLTQGKTHQTDHSNASRTLLYNLHTRDYDEELLSLFDIPRSCLPEISDSNSHFGDYTVNEIKIPIMGILGDQQAALFGQCGWEASVCKATYGTGLFMMQGSEQSIISNKTMVSTVAWSLDGTNSYAIEGSGFTAGSAIQWCRDQLGLIKNASETESLARSVKDNGGVYFIPALSGLGAPYWQANARGSFVGLSQSSTKAHLIRAVLESIAYYTKLLSERMSNTALSCLRVDGGMVKNHFFTQFLADTLAVPIEVPKVTETTAFGIAALVAFSNKTLSLDTINSKRGVAQQFTPQNKNENDYEHWKDHLQKTLQ